MTDTEATASSWTLDGVIDRLEGALAVIRTADGQNINWPRAQLPPETGEGSVVKLSMLNDELAQKERERLTKNILNELLKTDDQI